MTNDKAAQLAARQANFPLFYHELTDVLVDFIGCIGFNLLRRSCSRLCSTCPWSNRGCARWRLPMKRTVVG